MNNYLPVFTPGKVLSISGRESFTALFINNDNRWQADFFYYLTYLSLPCHTSFPDIE